MKTEDLKEWFKEIIRYGGDISKYIQTVGESNDPVRKEHNTRFHLFTQDHIYNISVTERDDGGYLGCTVSTRKARAGEDWNRGNDLPDGKFEYATWCKIKDAIIAYELVLLDIQKLSE